MADTDYVSQIVEKHTRQQGGIISILQDIQSKFNYLPEDALRRVAEETGKSLVDIYGIATFYKFFSLKPRGKHIVSVCLGTACHVRGGKLIAEEFERQMGISAGDTTPDKEFTLETVACLGACALGPIVVADGRYFSNVNKSAVKKILQQTQEGFEKADFEEKVGDSIFIVEVNCARCNHTLMDSTHHVDGYPSIRVTISFERKHGWLRLSSLYGSYTIESEYEIPPDLIVHFFCPHCHAELRGATDCSDCGAPMVPLIVRGDGMAQICSRHGCKGHMLDVDGVNL